MKVDDSAFNGAAGQPAVLLVMGLGMQLTAWPADFVRALVAAGYRVIRFDNRDAGLSQSLDELGKPSLLWDSMKYKLGLRIKPPYSVQDMALDALGVLDALALQQAHVVGVSLGGMIAQRMALTQPWRVTSLTSIMSTSSAPGLPPPQPAVVRALLGSGNGKTPDAVVSNYIKLMQAISSPGFPLTQAQWCQRIQPEVRRSYRPAGTLRQMLAAIADVDRAPLLAGIRTPTLVLHGKSDPLLPFACGQDTARRIPGAKLVGIEGMGHDLPPGVVRQLLKHLLPHLGAHSAVQDCAQAAAV
ncbi:MAG: alpha/beta fold hydrolase [Burkholderiales bacterium]